MDFLKKHGEKILLLLLLLVLAGAVFMAMNAKNNYQSISMATGGSGQVDLSMDTEGIQGLINHLSGDPLQLAVVTNAFTPEVRVICMNPNDRTLISKDAKVCPYCGWEQTAIITDFDKDGIPDFQENEWNMNFEDPNDVFLDQDGDGFTTIVEWEYGEDPLDTDPTDPASYPPLIDYLRLVEVKETSIAFELRGTAKLGSGYTLQMKWKYPDDADYQTEYVKVGSTFGRQDEFKAESFTEKRELINGKYVDQSRAIIRSGNYSVALGRVGEERKGKMTERSGTIELIMGPEWQEVVRVDQTIELDKKTYKVVDINSQSIVIKPNDAGNENVDPLTIRKATQEELEALKPPPVEEESFEDAMFMEFPMPMN